MAIYYFNLVTVQGSKKRLIAKVLASTFGITSSVSKINQICNYLIKPNGLLHNKIMLPFQTQDLISDRSKLWNYSERNKKASIASMLGNKALNDLIKSRIW